MANLGLRVVNSDFGGKKSELQDFKSELQKKVKIARCKLRIVKKSQIFKFAKHVAKIKITRYKEISQNHKM